MVGSADSANHVFAAYDCQPTGAGVDVNEAVDVRWVSMQEASRIVQTGEVVGAASVVALSELTARNATRR